MFHGTHPDVIRAYGEASRLARTLGHPRVGSEHLLCALAGAPGPTGDLLRAGGLTPGRLAAVLDGLDGVSAAVVADVVTRGLVEEAGQDEETTAVLYRTTSYFMERVGITSLADLPELAPFLPEMGDLDDPDEHLADVTESVPEDPGPA